MIAPSAVELMNLTRRRFRTAWWIPFFWIAAISSSRRWQ